MAVKNHFEVSKLTIKISVMEYKPFTSQYSNVYNEALYRTVPDPYGLKDATGTQIQNRNIYDSSTISVHPNAVNAQHPHAVNAQQQHLADQCRQRCQNYPSAQIRTMQQQIPGGVRFTFNSSPKTYGVQNFSQPNPCSSQPINQSSSQTYAYNPEQLEIHQYVHPQLHYSSKPCMPNQCYMQDQTQVYHSESVKPYQLQFHYNGQTSTSDLLANPNQMQPSMGTPDYSNLAGIIDTLNNCIETELPIILHQSTKILLLTKSPDIKQTSEEIREQDKNPTDLVHKNIQTEQRVSFDETDEQKSVKKNKKKKSKRCKKGTRRSKTSTKCKDLARPSQSMSSISLSDDDEDSNDDEDSDNEDDHR